MPVQQPDVRRDGLRFAGGQVEPVVAADALRTAIDTADVDMFRPLLPVGYRVVADAYKSVASSISVGDLTHHYTNGLSFFHDEFVPVLKERLSRLTGHSWDLDAFEAYAAGSDVDLMSHLIEAVAARGPVHLFPGDWYGFQVGCTHPDNIRWRRRGDDQLACLCVPSVRNGHFTDEMLEFVDTSSAALLNINLFPTLTAQERRTVADQLLPVLPRSIISISFSRGFGLTASQLGVFLVHRDHPYRCRFEQQWNWHTYFYNAIAAKAFLEIDLDLIGAVDDSRRRWVHDWLRDHGLPIVETGSYYVKSFQVDDPIPDALGPLVRDGLVRLCFKPPLT